MDRDPKFLYQNRWQVRSRGDWDVLAEAWTLEELAAEGWTETSEHFFHEMFPKS